MATNNKFKSGDVVKLKSGGPKMTINQIVHSTPSGTTSNGGVFCYWFDGEELKRGEFSDFALMNAENDEDSSLGSMA